MPGTNQYLVLVFCHEVIQMSDWTTFLGSSMAENVADTYSLQAIAVDHGVGLVNAMSMPMSAGASDRSMVLAI